MAMPSIKGITHYYHETKTENDKKKENNVMSYDHGVVTNMLSSHVVSFCFEMNV